MRLSLLYLGILITLVSSRAIAQTTYSGRVIDEKGTPIQDVNVLLYRTQTSLLGYGFTGEDGRFEISIKRGASPLSIGFKLLGYETKMIKAEEYKNGSDIRLKSAVFELKEVNIRPDRIVQKQDTLVYNVASFKLSHDKNIADVISKMPGLDVLKNGQITFEGKPINKLYIEGLDLLGSKYAQASENISADKVKNVEVLQNHQPIRSLMGVRFSEQAALNIVLKDEVKNVWSGVMNVGLGYTAQHSKEEGRETLYSGRLMGMVFGRRMQNLSMYKCDNTGKDLTREIRDLVTDLRNLQEEQGLLSGLVAPAAALDRERSIFNQSHLVTTNHLVRTKSDNDLRLQLSYLWDKERGKTSQVTKYLEHQGATLSEISSVEARESSLKGELTYKVNKRKNYVNNSLYGSFTVDKSNGPSILQQRPIEQQVTTKKSYLTEDFEIIHRMPNGNTLEGASLTTYSHLPGQLLTVEGFTQRLHISAIQSKNHVAFNHKVKGFNFSQRIGYQLKLQEIGVHYPEVDDRERYAQQNLYISTGANYRKGPFSLKATLKADVLHQKYETEQKVRGTLQPYIFVQYQFSGKINGNISYNYAEYPDALSTIYRTPIYTSYRMVTEHTGSLSQRGNHAVALGLKYQNPLKGLFASLNTSWNRRTNEVLYQSTLQSTIYKQRPTAQRYNASSYQLRGKVARSLYFWRTLISLDGRQLWSDYFLFQDGERMPWQMLHSELKLSLAMQPSRAFSYELTSKMLSNKQVNMRNHLDPAPRITSFSHTLELFIHPLNELEIGCKSELYHYTDKSLQSSLFTDAHIAYRQERYELRLSCRNIFGNNQYQRRWQTSITDIYSIYHLRPRELFLDFSISF